VVWADLEVARVQVGSVAGHLVEVDQHLLGGGVVLVRTPATDRILEALDGPAVVPPRALAHRHREVGLLRARLDLLEHGLAQVGRGRQHVQQVCVLALEVRDHLGVVTVAEPRVVVDDRLAVQASLHRHPFGCGWRGADGGWGSGRRRLTHDRSR
jgi:hypothetical protein